MDVASGDPFAEFDQPLLGIIEIGSPVVAEDDDREQEVLLYNLHVGLHQVA